MLFYISRLAYQDESALKPVSDPSFFDPGVGPESSAPCNAVPVCDTCSWSHPAFRIHDRGPDHIDRSSFNSTAEATLQPLVVCKRSARFNLVHRTSTSYHRSRPIKTLPPSFPWPCLPTRLHVDAAACTCARLHGNFLAGHIANRPGGYLFLVIFSTALNQTSSLDFENFHQPHRPCPCLLQPLAITAREPPDSETPPTTSLSGRLSQMVDGGLFLSSNMHDTGACCR